MKYLQQNEIQIHVEAGHPDTKQAFILDRGMGLGYMLGFGQNMGAIEIICSSHREQVRPFKTLDAANRIAAKLGFKTVTILNEVQ
jgi:hypothetical protein